MKTTFKPAYRPIYIAVLFLILISGCKSNFSIAMRPDKSAYTSGTIGSVRVTSYPSNSDIESRNLSDTSRVKYDTLPRNQKLPR